MNEVTQVANDAIKTVSDSGFNWQGIAVWIAIFGALYFLMIRPNKKRMADYKKMLDALKIGDRVMAAGIFGTIKKVSEKTIEIEIAKGVVIEVAKNAVANVE
jgi:preprotein translocase subunit YajC